MKTRVKKFGLELSGMNQREGDTMGLFRDILTSKPLTVIMQEAY